MGVTTYYSVGGEIIGERSGGVRTDYLRDALGSVTATKRTDRGTISNTYRYKPYGERLAKTGVAADPRFGWRGFISMANSKILANQAKTYNPYSGQVFAVSVPGISPKGTFHGGNLSPIAPICGDTGAPWSSVIFQPVSVRNSYLDAQLCGSVEFHTWWKLPTGTITTGIGGIVQRVEIRARSFSYCDSPQTCLCTAGPTTYVEAWPVKGQDVDPKQDPRQGEDIFGWTCQDPKCIYGSVKIYGRSGYVDGCKIENGTIWEQRYTSPCMTPWGGLWHLKVPPAIMPKLPSTKELAYTTNCCRETFSLYADASFKSSSLLDFFDSVAVPGDGKNICGPEC